jgi:hypothetical protein
MNLPDFTAEASLYPSGPYCTARYFCVGRTGPAVEAALRNRGGFECTGTCPAGQLLCKSDSNCVCCKYGCDTTPGGVAVCRSSPGRTGGGGGYTNPGGGVFSM